MASGKAIAEVEEVMLQRLETSIRIWQAELLRTLSGQRTGAEYLVPGTKVMYQASAPGEAPAVRTGRLRASYRTEVSRAALTAFIGSDEDYSIWLERGTQKMEPRPAIEPAFMVALPKIREVMQDAFSASSDVNYKED